MADEKQSSPLPRIIAAASFVLLAVIYFFHSQAEKKKPIGPPPEENAPIANTADLSTPNGSTTPVAPIDPNLPRLDRAHADALREKLKQLALTPPTSEAPVKSGSGDYPVMPHGEGASDPALRDYIHQKIKDDYLPLAKSCYENALVKTPDLSGRLVMKFKIVGDKRVGGVVDSVETDPETTMHDDPFLQCVQESMMAVSFDAPPNDGSVTVKYPLIFSPGDGGESHDL
ncbi:MAG: AgmX/PglI C-terminal domain-containing protein [Polyangiaceae bacterium]